MSNAAATLECIADWKSLGVRVGIDDFGAAYSSLSYLSRLPVDRLKIDGSLVRSMTSESKDEAIVRAVILLGRELGFEVLAEGVETEEQFRMLERLGCQQVQGYLLSPPTSATVAQGAVDTRWGMRNAGIRSPERAAARGMGRLRITRVCAP